MLNIFHEVIEEYYNGLPLKIIAEHYRRSVECTAYQTSKKGSLDRVQEIIYKYLIAQKNKGG